MAVYLRQNRDTTGVFNYRKVGLKIAKYIYCGNLFKNLKLKLFTAILFLIDLFQYKNTLGFKNFKSYFSEYKGHPFVIVLDFVF